MENAFLADYCWTVSGSNRKKILLSFNSEVIPSQIAKSTKLRFSVVSRALKDMVSRGVVKRIKIDKRKNLYRLTERGMLVVEKIVRNSG